MGIKIENRVIGDTEYEVHQLGFAAQRATFVKLANIGGPVLVGMLKELMQAAAKSKTKGDAVEAFTKALGDVDVTKAADVLSDFLARLSDKDLEHLTHVFGEKSRFKPAGTTGFMPLNYENRELHFAGDGFLEYFRWLAFALEVNYRGFFSGSSGLQELVRGLRRADKAEDAS